MLKNYLGKLFFPRLQRSQYNHQFKIVAATISFGLVAAGCVSAIIIWRGAIGL
jgi:hypothetical protein